MFTLIRVAAMVSVIAMRETLPFVAYASLFAATIFSHYLLSLWYARRRARPIVTGQVGIAAIVVLLALCVLPPVFMIPSLLAYQGLHNALSDGFMVAGGRPDTLDRAMTRLVWARMALSSVAYLLLLHASPELAFLPLPLLFGALAVASLAFVVTLVGAAPRLSRGQLLDTVVFELVWVGAALWLFDAGAWLMDLIFYHVMVWVFLPLHRIKELRGRVTFVLQTAIVTALILPLTPVVGLVPELSVQWWILAAAIGGYLHVSTSMAFSPFNPTWLVRFFSQRGSMETSTNRIVQPSPSIGPTDTSPA